MGKENVKINVPNFQLILESAPVGMAFIRQDKPNNVWMTVDMSTGDPIDRFKWAVMRHVTFHNRLEKDLVSFIGYAMGEIVPCSGAICIDTAPSRVLFNRDNGDFFFKDSPNKLGKVKFLVLCRDGSAVAWE